MLWSVLVILALITTGHCFQDNDINGIAAIVVTVSNLQDSVKFYSDTMGGAVISDFSRKDMRADDLYYRMFGKEITDASNQGTSPQTLGVPDIRTGGTHRVNWEFILFDNSLIWLLQFTEAGGKVLEYSDAQPGTAKTGYGQMGFWCQRNMNPYQMIQNVMAEQLADRNGNAGFTSIDDMTSFNQRIIYFRDNIDRFIHRMDNGLALTATRGPTGERAVFMFGVEYTNEFPKYCNLSAVHTAMLGENYPWNSNRYEMPRIKTNGFHHIGTTVADITVAVDFYTNVIGGKSPLTFKGNTTKPELRNILFQDDLLKAVELGVTTPEASFGYVETGEGYPNAGTFDSAFVNFDNFIYELYAFNPSNPADKARLTKRLSSIAQLRTVQPAFWIKDSPTVSMASYIKLMELKASLKGWTQVAANRAIRTETVGQEVGDNDYSRPQTTGTMEGFDFVFAKGPGGEPFVLTKFAGKAGKILKKKILEYGGVSTAFNATNPYTYGGYKEVCQKQNNNGDGNTNGRSGRSGTGKWRCTWKTQGGWDTFWECLWGSQGAPGGGNREL